MRYEIIGDHRQSPKIAILCPRIQVGEIYKYYYNPYLFKLKENVIVCDIFIDKTKKKTANALIKEYLDDYLPNLLAMGVELLIVTHSEYFKVLTKRTKAEATIGDVVKSRISNNLYVTYCPNYSKIFYDPDKTKDKIKICMESVLRWKSGDNSLLGHDIIQYEKYPKSYADIEHALECLLKMDCDLTCDIEGFSLKHYDSGIGTITFCWNEHEGIAFPIDYLEILHPQDKFHGKQRYDGRIREALKSFFKRFKRKMIYHNICFDVYVLVYQLFMDHILDQEGMLEGLEVLLKYWDCTQLLSYLATNSCAGNELGLKAQAQEYAGNYAKEDIKDIRLIPLDELLKYNLIDGLSTWYVYNKHMPTVITDDQLGIYNNIFKPAVVDVIQMQLTGLPIDMDKVIKTEKLLKKESNALIKSMNSSKIILSFVEDLKDEYVTKKNSEYKKKVITKADVTPDKVSFNPNSSLQLQKLLYSSNYLGLPVLDYTDSKQPATGADTLEKLITQTQNPETVSLLNTLIEYKASAIILSTFIPAMLNAQLGNDGWHYLFGNFRLGGTASGRLSSNDPNLQNLPSGGSNKFKKRLAKLIKQCIKAPIGWLFVGLDFDSLEDKISAVTTRDPNKIKVYSDGYDGHCLRALAYFGDSMPDIETCPEDAIAYEAIVKGTPIHFHSKETIYYLGECMTGEELYNKLKA